MVLAGVSEGLGALGAAAGVGGGSGEEGGYVNYWKGGGGGGLHCGLWGVGDREVCLVASGPDLEGYGGVGIVQSPRQFKGQLIVKSNCNGHVEVTSSCSACHYMIYLMEWLLFATITLSRFNPGANSQHHIAFSRFTPLKWTAKSMHHLS